MADRLNPESFRAIEGFDPGPAPNFSEQSISGSFGSVEDLTVPEGDPKENMALWEEYNQVLSKSQDKEKVMQQLEDMNPLFGQFNKIKRMGGDITMATDVDTPDGAGSGTALMLRGIGMAGQLVGAGGGPASMLLGTGINTGMNVLANEIDVSEGNPTEAVPFSGLATGLMGLENPFTTGDPVKDALVEGSIDAITGLGVLGKMGNNVGRMLGKKSLAEYVSTRLDPKFVEDLLTLEQKAGLEVPLALKQEGIGGSLAQTISSVTSARPEDKKLLDNISQSLVQTWRAHFGLDVNNLEITDDILAGFNSGLEKANALKSTEGLLPAQKSAIVSMTKFNRIREATMRIRDNLKMNFANTVPSLKVSSNTAIKIKEAQDTLDALNVTGDPKLTGISKSLNRLKDVILKPAEITKVPGKQAIRDANINLSTVKEFTEPTSVEKVIPPDFKLLDASKNPDAPDTILNLIDSLDDKISSLDKLSAGTQSDVSKKLTAIRDSLNNDILGSLNDEQKVIYGRYRAANEHLNSVPQQMLNAVSAGEMTGFIEGLISSKSAARRFIQDGVVTKDEAATMLGEYLLSKGKKTLDNGDTAIDFVKIKDFVDNPKNREGVVELLGSEKLGLFRQFANVAANTTPTKSTGSVARHALIYSPLAGGYFMLMDPARALVGTAATTGIAVSANQVLKRLLFNPKIGRDAIEMLKMGDNTPQARKAYSAAMAALNGHEAMSIYIDQENRPRFSERIVIRQGVGGQPKFERFDSDSLEQ